MSTIRVRRSGLTALAVRVGSVFTGLVFVVLITLNLSSAQFGLWGLISKTMGYLIGFSILITFWTTRYRARGVKLGRTVLFLGGVLALFLTPIFVLISSPVASSVAPVSQLGNLFYFLLSAPQVPLYIVVAVLEYLIMAYAPGKAYGGFAAFEISKVIVGLVAISVLRLSLTGAIISVIVAQMVQLVYLLVLQSGEFSEKISSRIIRSMLKGSWITLLNSFQSWLISLDYVVIAVFTASTIPLAFYGAAFTIAGVVGSASVLTAGLYPYILSGKEPTQATNQTIELELVFAVPAVIGSILLSNQVLYLLNPAYVVARPILYVLSISAFFSLIQGTLDNVVTGSDTVDTQDKITLSAYLNSKIFLMTKLNIGFSAAYLAGIVGIGSALDSITSVSVFGYSGYVAIAIYWSIASLVMYSILFFLKLMYARRVAKISVTQNLIFSIAISSVLYSLALLALSSVIIPHGGALLQALYILAIGVPSLVVYFACMFALSKSMRELIRAAVRLIRSSSVQT